MRLRASRRAREGAVRVPGGWLVAGVACECQATPLVVRLLKKRDSADREGNMQDRPFPHRREFMRVPVHLAADVTVDGVPCAGGTMENVSLKGGFLRIANGPPEGAACDIRMHLDGTDVVVHARGMIVRMGPAGCAIQFHEIVGLDSLEHLRNLILFNSHDPAQVEHEFRHHLGLRPDR